MGPQTLWLMWGAQKSQKNSFRSTCPPWGSLCSGEWRHGWWLVVSIPPLDDQPRRAATSSHPLEHAAQGLAQYLLNKFEEKAVRPPRAQHCSKADNPSRHTFCRNAEGRKGYLSLLIKSSSCCSQPILGKYLVLKSQKQGLWRGWDDMRPGACFLFKKH